MQFLCETANRCIRYTVRWEVRIFAVVQNIPQNRKVDKWVFRCRVCSTLKKLKISNALELALSSARAKNNIADKALFADFIGKAELAEDGTVKGLDAEVKKLVEGKETAFLFEKSTGTKFKGAKSAEKGDGAEGGMTLEKLKAMTPIDRYNYSVNHPDEYKELYGGNE